MLASYEVHEADVNLTSNVKEGRQQAAAANVRAAVALTMEFEWHATHFSHRPHKRTTVMIATNMLSFFLSFSFNILPAISVLHAAELAPEFLGHAIWLVRLPSMAGHVFGPRNFPVDLFVPAGPQVVHFNRQSQVLLEEIGQPGVRFGVVALSKIRQDRFSESHRCGKRHDEVHISVAIHPMANEGGRSSSSSAGRRGRRGGGRPPELGHPQVSQEQNIRPIYDNTIVAWRAATPTASTVVLIFMLIFAVVHHERNRTAHGDCPGHLSPI